MIKINFIKILLLVFTCKNTTRIFHNKRKHGEISSKNEERRYEHIKRPYSPMMSEEEFIGVDLPLDEDISELDNYLFENGIKKSINILEEDPFAAFFEDLKQFEAEYTDTNEIQCLCDEVLSAVPFDQILTPFSSEEENSIDSTTQSTFDQILTTFSLEEENSINSNAQSTIQTKDSEESLSHKDTLERLNALYASFFMKPRTNKKKDVLNRCFVLFPETITLLYIKVKNNESNKYINSIFERIYDIYKKNIVSWGDTIDVIYTKRINFREEMSYILRNELPNLSNHVLLYETLSNLEELAHNIQLSQYKKRITKIFNIIFLLETENVLFLLPKIKTRLNNIKRDHSTHLIINSDIENLNRENIFSKIIMIKEIYDGVLPFLSSHNTKRQAINDYFDYEMQKFQNKQDDCLIAITVFKMLNALEVYKETFQLCVFKNSSYSFTTFFAKNIEDAVEGLTV